MEPIVNIEETPDKVVGKRRPSADAFKTAMQLQRLVGQLQKTFGNPGIPRGVFRFNSHAEADEWTWKMLTRRRVS